MTKYHHYQQTLINTHIVCFFFHFGVLRVHDIIVGYNIIRRIRPYSHPDENLWCVGFHLIYKYKMHIERALGHNICITRLVESIRFEQNCFLQGGRGTTRCRSCFPRADTYTLTSNWSTDPVLQHTLASTRVVKCTYIILYTKYTNTRNILTPISYIYKDTHTHTNTPAAALTFSNRSPRLQSKTYPFCYSCLRVQHSARWTHNTYKRTEDES